MYDPVERVAVALEQIADELDEIGDGLGSIDLQACNQTDKLVEIAGSLRAIEARP